MYYSRAGAIRVKKCNQIIAQIKNKQKRTYWLALHRQGNSKNLTDETVAFETEELEKKLLDLEIPTLTEAQKALKRASNEVKYVFGILGISPHTFVILVNELRFETLQNMLNVIDIICDTIDEWEVPYGTGAKLAHYCYWHRQFMYTHLHHPDVIGTHFNELVWEKHAQCLESPAVYNTTRQLQPTRACKKEPLVYKSCRWHYTFYNYRCYSKYDLINRATKEIEIQSI